MFTSEDTFYFCYAELDKQSNPNANAMLMLMLLASVLVRYFEYKLNFTTILTKLETSYCSLSNY